MSRESWEQSEQNWNQSERFQGIGHPSVHDHYPGDGGEVTCTICTPSYKPEYGTLQSLREHQRKLNELNESKDNYEQS